MARTLFLCAVTLLCSATAYAQSHFVDIVDSAESDEPWKAPTGFRDVPFGASEQEASAILGPLKCANKAATSTPAHRQCTTTDKKKAFRANNAVVMTYYIFHEGKFVGVEMNDLNLAKLSKQPLFQFLLPAFREKYGEATSAKIYHHYGVRDTSDSWEQFDYKTATFDWLNDQAHVLLVSGENATLEYGVVETRRWRDLKAAPKQPPPANVTPF